MPNATPRVAAAVITTLLSVAASPAQDLTGTWFTTRGVLEVRADGKGWRGSYGDGSTLEARKEGTAIVFTATEGRAQLEGTLTVAKGAYRFDGTWRTQQGGSGTWKGWRHDPATEKGSAAKVAGYWRSSWGLVEIEPKGKALKGGFGAQGWSTFTGTLKGRFVELDYQSPFGKGTFRIDVDADGQRAFGSAESPRGSYALQLQRLDGYERSPKPKPGELVAGVAKNRMLYYLRAPKGYQPGSDAPLLVFLHGSNYVSKPYVESIAATPVGERCVVVGIDGEAWLDSSEPNDPRQNYTYVNFMGRSTYEGYPHTDRESPALVAEVIQDLQQQLGTKRTFVGGHSQGGFLTWFFAMHYPELVDGVFPMSSGMVMQCEADVFADAALKQAQRDVAIAVVHGRNDDTVAFTQGEGTFLRTKEHGFPMLRLFANDAGHGFAALPWQPAVEWLEAMTSRDPAVLERTGQQALDDQRFRDASACVLRLYALDANSAAAARIAKAVDERAGGELARFAAALDKPGDGAWIDEFLRWRDQFEFAACAKGVMAKFARLRADHEPKAKQLLDDARGLFQQGKRDAGWQKYEELARTCWAASLYRSVKGWLAERK